MQWLPQVFKHGLFDWESSELKIKVVFAGIIFASPYKALLKLKLANAQPFFYSEYKQGNESTCVKKYYFLYVLCFSVLQFFLN